MSCSQKIVVGMVVASDMLYETEYLDFDVGCVGSTECPCPCDRATNASCTCYNLDNAVRVAVTKTPAYASYPLTYVQRVDGHPWERIVYTTKDKAQVDYDSEEPTCSDWVDSTGTRIQYSTGKACYCPDVSSGYTMDWRRGALTCKYPYPSDATLVNTSVHCLQHSNTFWYSGYLVGTYQVAFDISIEVTIGDSSETIHLTPSNPKAVDSQKVVRATLEGDLLGYHEIPDLATLYLFVPNPPGHTSAEWFSMNRDRWIIVEPSDVDFSGTTCNVIGIDYEGFVVTQGIIFCRDPAGYCLYNQLFDFNLSDYNAYMAGSDINYWIKRYGGSNSNTNQASSDTSGSLMLNLPIEGISNSLITIEVAADNVSFTTNVSPAVIGNVQVCSSSGSVCGTFEAMSGIAYVTVAVTNTGYIAAEYVVSITDCTDGIYLPLAQSASIESFDTADFTFALQTTTDVGANNSCTATTKSALGAVLDELVFTFSTTNTTYQNITENPEGLPTNNTAGSWFCWNCHSTLNVFSALPCYGKYQCWEWPFMVRSITVCIAVFIGVFSFFVATYFGVFDFAFVPLGKALGIIPKDGVVPVEGEEAVAPDGSGYERGDESYYDYGNPGAYGQETYGYGAQGYDYGDGHGYDDGYDYGDGNGYDDGYGTGEAGDEGGGGGAGGAGGGGGVNNGGGIALPAGEVLSSSSNFVK